MKYCSKCGASNPGDAKFCRSCGAKFTSRGGRIAICICISVGILLVIVLFSPFAFCSHKDEPKPNPIIDNDSCDIDSVNVDSFDTDYIMDVELIDAKQDFYPDRVVLYLDVKNNNIENHWGCLVVRIKFYETDDIHPIIKENGDVCEETAQFSFEGEKSKNTYSLELSRECTEYLCDFFDNAYRSAEYCIDPIIKFDVILENNNGQILSRKNNYSIHEFRQAE